MKKRILKLTMTLAVVAVAGYAAYSSQIKIQLDGVTLNNVEALASGESDHPTRACSNGTPASMNDPDAKFLMLCDPCGSYTYIFPTSHSRC